MALSTLGCWSIKITKDPYCWEAHGKHMAQIIWHLWWKYWCSFQFIAKNEFSANTFIHRWVVRNQMHHATWFKITPISFSHQLLPCLGGGVYGCLWRKKIFVFPHLPFFVILKLKKINVLDLSYKSVFWKGKKLLRQKIHSP